MRKLILKMSLSIDGFVGGPNGTTHLTLLSFGAVVCQVPLLDMQRYSKLLAGASWMAEYGDPDKPEEWAFIRTFSPYHTVRKDVKYPPVLLTTSTRDDCVHPGHARKMMARMQEQGHDVVHDARGVHEDEGAPPDLEGVAVASRRFSFPAVQVQQAFPAHGVEPLAEPRIDPGKYPPPGPGQVLRVVRGKEQSIDILPDQLTRDRIPPGLQPVGGTLQDLGAAFRRCVGPLRVTAVHGLDGRPHVPLARTWKHTDDVVELGGITPLERLPAGGGHPLPADEVPVH